MIHRIDYSGDLTDRDALVELLIAAGLGPASSRSKADLFARAASQLARIEAGGGAARPAALFVPGRIEVMGKHTDYAGGQSMVAAAERGFCLVLSPRDDSRIVVSDVEFDDTIECDLDSELVPQPGHWSNYPMTAARRVVRNFPGATRGAAIAMGSDLPPAAGMSSSSAMIVAMSLALARVNDLWARPEMRENVKNLVDLAGYLAVVENGQTFGTLKGDRGVGTFGGSEDHTAILCSRPNTVGQYSYCPLRFERTVPMPKGYTFAVGACGVEAEKTGGAMAKYNRASRLAGACAELWRSETGRDEPHLAAVVASSPDAAERMRRMIRDSAVSEEGITPEALLARFEHFFCGERRTPSGRRRGAGSRRDGSLRPPDRSIPTECRRSPRQPNSRDGLPGQDCPRKWSGRIERLRRGLRRQRLGRWSKRRGSKVFSAPGVTPIWLDTHTTPKPASSSPPAPARRHSRSCSRSTAIVTGRPHYSSSCSRASAIWAKRRLMS